MRPGSVMAKAPGAPGSGGGICPCDSSTLPTSESAGLRSRAAQTEKASRPPARSTRRVSENAAAGSVADHERHVLLTLWERQRVLLVVADYVEPSEAPPHLRSGEVHAVVVVPERSGSLLQRVGVVFEATTRSHIVHRTMFAARIVRRSPRHDEVRRVAVALGGSTSPVQVRGDRHRKLVGLSHDGLSTAAALYGGAGEDALVAPYLRLFARQDLQATCLLRYLVVVCFGVEARGLQHRRHRQGVRNDSGSRAMLRSRFPIGASLSEEQADAPNGKASMAPPARPSFRNSLREILIRYPPRFLSFRSRDPETRILRWCDGYLGLLRSSTPRNSATLAPASATRRKISPATYAEA